MNLVKSIIAGAVLAVSATAASASTLPYSADTGSYYEIVYDRATYSDALAGAASSTYTVGGDVAVGTLVAIETWAEFSFLSSEFAGMDYWVAASDAANEGDWVWTDGPSAGTSIDMNIYGGMWIGGEPDDTFAGQDYAFMHAGAGLLQPRNPNGAFAYVIEYAGLPPVPVPGGLPLVAGAFGLLALAKKRRKKA